MDKIGVLGAGTMGTGIARVVAENGCPVILRDIESDFLEKGKARLKKGLERDIKKERITENQADEIMAKIEFTLELEKMADVDLIIEAIVEKMSVKKEVFKKLDKICAKDTILATNTSALSVTEIAAATRRPDKVLGIHFFNPVPVMKLVELIKGVLTSDQTFLAAAEFIKKIKKEAVEVKEAPGFVVNRLLIPMINEAAFLLQEGTAVKEDIDQAMKLGANHPLGPLALADLVGLDVCLAIMETLQTEFGEDKYRPCPLLRKKVRAQQLGRKTGKGFYEY